MRRSRRSSRPVARRKAAYSSSAASSSGREASRRKGRTGADARAQRVRAAEPPPAAEVLPRAGPPVVDCANRPPRRENRHLEAEMSLEQDVAAARPAVYPLESAFTPPARDLGEI